MSSVNLFGDLLKSLFVSGKNPLSSESGKLPARFLGLVMEVKGELALLNWQGEPFYVKIEVPVKKGELLLLELKEEKDAKRIYRVLARSTPTEKDELIEWDLFLHEKVNTPLYIKARYFPRRKGNSNEPADKPCLELSIKTQNLGLITLSVLTLAKPYKCRFIVERKEFGEVVESSLRLLLEQSAERLPVEFLPYRVCPPELLPGSASVFLDKKA
ncbi:MAG: hypothetical protein GX764_00070 [Firmicutes bacterium]|nr:hypothetical protein [Bacillota bacterium]